MQTDRPPEVVQIPPVARQFSQKVPPDPPVPTHTPDWQTIELGQLPQATSPPHPFAYVPHSFPSSLHVEGWQHRLLLHGSPFAQEPQASVPPQPFGAAPHWLSEQLVAGTHV